MSSEIPVQTEGTKVPSSLPLIVAIDYETTGINTKTDEIIEKAWVTFDHKNIYNMSNYLLHTVPEVSPVITNITGITTETLTKYGYNWVSVLYIFITDLYTTEGKLPDYFAAHFGEQFDQHFFKRYIKAYFDLMPTLQPEDKKLKDCILDTPWIDTSKHLPYPEKITTRKLTYLMLEHGLTNSGAHRAMFDALGVAWLIQKYSMTDILRLMNEKVFKLECITTHVKIDGGASNKWAKENGFKFDWTLKKWLRSVRESEYELLTKSSPCKLINFD